MQEPSPVNIYGCSEFHSHHIQIVTLYITIKKIPRSLLHVCMQDTLVNKCLNTILDSSTVVTEQTWNITASGLGNWMNLDLVSRDLITGQIWYLYNQTWSLSHHVLYTWYWEKYLYIHLR